MIYARLISGRVGGDGYRGREISAHHDTHT
jgi:hypothetical protein